MGSDSKIVQGLGVQETWEEEEEIPQPSLLLVTEENENGTLNRPGPIFEQTKQVMENHCVMELVEQPSD